MVNTTNRSQPLPTFDLSAKLTDGPVNIAGTSDAAVGGLSALANAAGAFGDRMMAMARSAATREGTDAAAKDLASGQAVRQNDASAFGASYNAVMKDAKGAEFKAALLGDIDKALQDNPDDPEAFAKAAQAARAGYGSTGFADLDADLNNYATLQVAAGVAKARQGKYQRTVEAARGAFMTTLNAEQALIGHTVTTAAFDPQGSALVAGQIARTFGNLAKYGPRDAFDVGDLHFDADPSRLGVMGVDDLSKLYGDVTSEARGQWAVASAERLPDAAAKRAFAEDAAKRYAANDPLFAGLSRDQFDAVHGQLESVYNRADSQEKADRATAARAAGDMIQALQWGGDVDSQALLSAAAASGDVGLYQQARVMAAIGPQVPGVLRRVAAARGGGDGSGIASEDADAWRMPENVVPGSAEFYAWVNTKEGFATDPLKYAHGGKRRAPMADIAPIVPDGWQQGGDAASYWGAALQQRAGIGQALHDSYGVPLRMLTNAETRYYADAISRDPAYAINLASAASAALGPDGARQLMAEVGRDSTAKSDVHLAMLTAGGSAGFAASAVQGRQLRSEGQKDPKFDARDGGDPFDTLMSGLAPALANVPSLGASARKIAEDARLADVARGVHRNADYYVNGALGAVSRGGNTYGGITTINGRQTLIPPWMPAAKSQAALALLGEAWTKTMPKKAYAGPVWSNGARMTPAEIAKMQLVKLGDGTYGLVHPKSNQVFRDASGQPFRANLDKAKSWLLPKLGN